MWTIIGLVFLSIVVIDAFLVICLSITAGARALDTHREELDIAAAREEMREACRRNGDIWPGADGG